MPKVKGSIDLRAHSISRTTNTKTQFALTSNASLTVEQASSSSAVWDVGWSDSMPDVYQMFNGNNQQLYLWCRECNEIDGTYIPSIPYKSNTFNGLALFTNSVANLSGNNYTSINGSKITTGRIQSQDTNHRNFIQLSASPDFAAGAMEFKNANNWTDSTQGIQWTGSELNIKGNIRVTSGSDLTPALGNYYTSQQIEAKGYQTEAQVTSAVNSIYNNYGYRYKKDIVVYGESNKYYPVIFCNQESQYVPHEFFIYRGYNEQGPDDWNTSTHKGSLTLKLKWNYGGWGGATYKVEVLDFTEMYSTMLGNIQVGTGSGMNSTVWLRGGGTTGALYHIYSEYPIETTRYGTSYPYIGLTAGTVYMETGSYTWTVPAALDAPNSTNIANLTSILEEQYIYISKAVGTTSVAVNTTWVTTSSDSQNTWTTKRPTYNRDYPVLFIAKQRKSVSGSILCTTPIIDDTTTVIEGGNIITGSVGANQIAANSISAKHLKISDTTNLATATELNENSLPSGIASDWLTTINNGYLIKPTATNRYLMVCNYTPNTFKQNDELYFEFYGKAATAGSISIGAWGYNSSRACTTSNVTSISLTTTEAKYSGTIKLTNANWDSALEYILGFDDARSPASQIYVRKVIIRRKEAGELIVDGSITGNKIAANSITANKLTIGALSSDNLFLGAALDDRSTFVANPDTDFSKHLRYYNGDSTYHTFTEYAAGVYQDTITLPDGSGNIGIAFARRADEMALDSNSYYTITCWAKCTSASLSLAIGLSYYNNSNAWIWRGGTNLTQFTSANTWQKFTLTFKPDADTQAIDYCFTVANNSGSQQTFTIRNCRMEKTEVKNYITDVGNDGIKIHAKNDESGKNLLLDSDSLSINYGELPSMELTDESLSFYEIDRDNADSKLVSSFSRDSIDFITDNSDISVSSSGITLNNSGNIIAYFGSRGAKINTPSGLDAFEIINSSTSVVATTINRPIEDWLEISSGQTATRGWRVIKRKVLPKVYADDSDPATPIEIYASDNFYTSKQTGTVAKRYTITRDHVRGLDTSQTYISETIYSRSWTSVSMKVCVQYVLENAAHKVWLPCIAIMLRSLTENNQTINNNWYYYIDHITYSSNESLPLTKNYGVIQSRSYRTLDDAIIGSYIKLRGSENDSYQSLTNSYGEIPMSYLIDSYGNAFSHTNNRIRCEKSGLVLVWGEARMTDSFSTSSASALYVRTCKIDTSSSSTGLKVSRHRYYPNSNGQFNTDILVAPRLIEVGVGDVLVLQVENGSNNGGKVNKGASYLDAVFLAPFLPRNI